MQDFLLEPRSSSSSEGGRGTHGSEATADGQQRFSALPDAMLQRLCLAANLRNLAESAKKQLTYAPSVRVACVDPRVRAGADYC